MTSDLIYIYIYMFDPTILLGNQMVRNFVCYILIEMGLH